ncbi:MAG: hypothetical protein ABSF09_06640 [Candidatus Bathyarchaeia archaeon]|jgi:predicted lipoprotein with Yx(FWY)xxD motif
MTQINSASKIVWIVSLVLTIILSTSTGYSLAYQTAIAQTQIPTPTMKSTVYSVNVANKVTIGSYLTNATGWTLYTFARDIPTNGTSRCTDNCKKNWPVFYTPNLTLSPGLNATSFSVVARSDGSKQIAYNGWPLYYFRNDTRPGDTNGQGFATVWFACTFPAPFTVTSAATTTVTSSTKTTTPSGGGGY